MYNYPHSGAENFDPKPPRETLQPFLLLCNQVSAQFREPLKPPLSQVCVLVPLETSKYIPVHIFFTFNVSSLHIDLFETHLKLDFYNPEIIPSAVNSDPDSARKD